MHKSNGKTKSLQEHLKSYGLRHFVEDDYWDWALENLGEITAERIDALREPLLTEEPAMAAEIAAFYDAIAEPRIASVIHSMKYDQIRASLEEVEKRIGGDKSILDLGCGLGYGATWYKGCDPRRLVVGVDASRKTLERAKASTDEDVSFVAANFEHLAIAGKFDVIVDAQSLYLARDPATLFQSLSALLSSNGKIISLPAIGNAQAAGPFLRAALDSGLALAEFNFVYYQDCGQTGALPIFVFCSDGPSRRLSLECEYETVMNVLTQVDKND